MCLPIEVRPAGRSIAPASYYRARYYDPTRNRFISEDPIGFAGGDANLFVYVGNRPLRHTDARGLWWASGHTTLTRNAMGFFNNAFSREDVDRVVRENVSVDPNRPLDNPAHSMPGTRDTAEWLISASLESAITLERAGLHDYALDALGRGLHTLQDRYAHDEQNAGWVRHGIGVGECDDPDRHPWEFSQAQDASRRYIDRFLLGIGFGR